MRARENQLQMIRVNYVFSSKMFHLSCVLVRLGGPQLTHLCSKKVVETVILIFNVKRPNVRLSRRGKKR